MKNQDIKQDIKNAGLFYWQVAERFGCTDGNFSRKLRHELSAEDKQKIRDIIKDIKGEN